MYTILHLPTNTYYGLHAKDRSKHTVVFFRNYDQAKYVADSLATHQWVYGKLPSPSTELYIMKPYQKKQNALEYRLWVQKRQASLRCMKEVGMRHLDVSFVKNIEWMKCYVVQYWQ